MSPSPSASRRPPSVTLRHPAVRCSARSSRHGGPCRAYAVRGGTVCIAHGGGAPRARVAAARNRAIAAAAHLGGSAEVDPLDVLLAAVREAWANVEVYRQAVAELGIHVGSEYVEERDPDGEVTHAETVRVDGVAVGSYYGERYHVEAAPHVLVAMYDSERDRAVRYSKLCIDAGVDERRVRLAERQAAELGGAIGRALDDVAAALTADQRDALRAAVARELRALGAGV